MSLESLRARALSRNTDAVLRYRVGLDADLEKALDDANDVLAAAKNTLALHKVEQQDPDRQAGPDNRYGAAPVTRAGLEEAASAAAVAAEQAERDALAVSVHLLFKRIPPDEYQALIFRHTTGDNFDMQAFPAELAEVCYLRCESDDGENVTLTWQQICTDVVNHGEREALHAAVVTHNREVVIHPSSPPRSATR